jgi:hypothetical protein
VLGIDWYSAAIILVAYVVGQMRTLSPRARYGVWCIAMALVTLFRIRLGFAGVNGIVAGISAALCVFYGYRAFRAPSR